MKWEKIAQRENDFLKNYIFYEALVENFIKVFDRYHPNFLTIRNGMSYTHYLNKESSTELAEFFFEKIKKNPKFMEEMFREGKKHFENLRNFCHELSDLENKDNNHLLELIKEYFRLYKKPYPYFMITVEARILEKEKTKTAEESINLMAKLRLYGRASFNKTHELVYPLFKEIANRFNISVKELKFLTPVEIESLLKGEKIGINQLIKDRDSCYFIHSDGKFKLYENALLEINNEKIDSENEIKGKGTFPSYYKGKVKLIHKKEDIENLEEGEVIVLQMTTTDLISDAIKKAGAIITDEGGITCHAAIISREFNIPALIGTRIATKVLKDGDIVEIDTKKGVVKKV
jgi:phosphoenolpyruvate synthase/pyruvate phosphate dikinase